MTSLEVPERNHPSPSKKNVLAHCRHDTEYMLDLDLRSVLQSDPAAAVCKGLAIDGLVKQTVVIMTASLVTSGVAASVALTT